MKTKPPTPRGRASTRRNGFQFEAADVTGTHRLTATDVQRNAPAGAVARALAARMNLPQTVPWVLRDDSSGNYLEDQRAIGEQIESDSQLTLTAKVHLGGR